MSSYVGGLSVVTLLYLGFTLLPEDTHQTKTLFRTDASNTYFKVNIPDLTRVHQMLDLSHNMNNIKSVFSPLIPEYINPILFLQTGHASEVLIGTNDEEEYLLIAFEGSDDWMVNFDLTTEVFGPVGGKDRSTGRVHKGYNRALFNGMYGQIEKLVRNTLETRYSGYSRNNYDIYVTGHGSGGAMSVLTGAMLAKNLVNSEVSVITFGQPRLGNKDFTQWTNSLSNFALWRVVYKDDPVPRSPNRNLGYTHTGHLIQLEDDGATLYYQQKGGGGYIGAPESWYLNKKGPIVNAANSLFLRHVYGAASGLGIFSLWTEGQDLMMKTHMSENYIRYIEEKSLNLPSLYYVSHFVT